MQPLSVTFLLSEGLQLGGENSLFICQEFSVRDTVHACAALGQQADTNDWQPVKTCRVVSENTRNHVADQNGKVRV